MTEDAIERDVPLQVGCGCTATVRFGGRAAASWIPACRVKFDHRHPRRAKSANAMICVTFKRLPPVGRLPAS